MKVIMLIFFILNCGFISAQSEFVIGYNNLTYSEKSNINIKNFSYYLGYFKTISEKRNISIGLQSILGKGEYVDYDFYNSKYLIFSPRVKRFAINNNIVIRKEFNVIQDRFRFFCATGLTHIYVPQTIYFDKIIKKNRIYANLFGIRLQFGLNVKISSRFFLTSSAALDYFPNQHNINEDIHSFFSIHAMPFIGFGFKF